MVLSPAGLRTLDWVRNLDNVMHTVLGVTSWGAIAALTETTRTTHYGHELRRRTLRHDAHTQSMDNVVSSAVSWRHYG